MNNKIWNDFGIFGKRDDNRILDSHPLFGNKRQSYGPSFIVHRSSPGFMIHKRPWTPFAAHHNLQKKVPFLIHKRLWKPYAMNGGSKISSHKRDEEEDKEKMLHFLLEKFGNMEKVLEFLGKIQKRNKNERDFGSEEIVPIRFGKKEMKDLDKAREFLLKASAMNGMDNKLFPDIHFQRVQRRNRNEHDIESEDVKFEKKLGKGSWLYDFLLARMKKHQDISATPKLVSGHPPSSHFVDSKDSGDNEEETYETMEPIENKRAPRRNIRKKRLDEWNASGMDSDTFNSKSR